MTALDDMRAVEALLEESRIAVDDVRRLYERFPSWLKWCWPPSRRRYEDEWEKAVARADAAVDAVRRATSVVFP